MPIHHDPETPVTLWLRLGPDEDLEDFEDLDDLPFDEMGPFRKWTRHGIITDLFHGDHGIELFWGDEDGNVVRALSDEEEEEVERQLGASTSSVHAGSERYWED